MNLSWPLTVPYIRRSFLYMEQSNSFKQGVGERRQAIAVGKYFESMFSLPRIKEKKSRLVFPVIGR